MPAEETLSFQPVPPVHIDLPQQSREHTARIEVGGINLTLAQFAQLQEGHVLPLDESTDAPVSVYVGEKLIAQGQLVLIDDHYCVQLTEIRGQ